VTEKLEGRDKLIDAELGVLRAMTQGPLRAEGIKILAEYPFADVVHQLIFDTLREIPADSPQIIREQLPVRLNNKGFPDLDLEALFEPHNLTDSQAIALMSELRSKARRSV